MAHKLFTKPDFGFAIQFRSGQAAPYYLMRITPTKTESPAIYQFTYSEICHLADLIDMIVDDYPNHAKPKKLKL